MAEQRVAICSMFCNSVRRGDLGRFVRQIDALDWPDDAMRLYLIEGDSRDHTYDELCKWQRGSGRDIVVMQHHLGHTPKGSVTDPDRMIDCSTVGSRAVWSALLDGWAQYILWIESDLIWGPQLLSKLIATRVDIVAPWVAVEHPPTHNTDHAWLEANKRKGSVLYDTWSFRQLPDGATFDREQPPPSEPFPLYSAGSCLLMTARAARAGVHASDRAIVGWCEQARRAGYRVWCDPRVRVWHPNTA